VRRVALASLAVIAVACASQSPIPTDPATGLPILDQLPAFAGSIAATEWNESEGTPEGFGSENTVHADLASVIGALRALWREQDIAVTMGFIGPPAPDAATIVVHATGRDDEAVVGDELLMDVRRNERGWYVELVRHRMHCRRGIDPETEFCG
jgi:hypothetical protein